MTVGGGGRGGYDVYPSLSAFSYKVGIQHETDAIQLHTFTLFNATYIDVMQWEETLARSSDCRINT
jgi:hypothetical protein